MTDLLAFTTAAAVVAGVLFARQKRSKTGLPLFWQSQAEVEEKLATVIAGKTESLQIVLDWDRTITTSDSESSYGVLEEHQADHFRQKCRALFAKYWPIEQDPHLTIEEKTPHMLEWYKTANALFIEAGFTRGQIRTACAVANCSLRPDFVEIVRLAEEHKIPLLIFSAGVKDAIEELLKQKLPKERYNGKIPDIISVVSNAMIFENTTKKEDEEGAKLVGWSEPVVFMYNKNESHLRSSPIYPELLRRKNVLLAGDSLGDCTMAQGLPHAEKGVFRVGVVNHSPATAKGQSYVAKYKDAFDLVMADGWSLRPVLDVLVATIEGKGKKPEGAARKLIKGWVRDAEEAAAIAKPVSTPVPAAAAAKTAPTVPLTGTLPLPSAAEQAAASHHS